MRVVVAGAMLAGLAWGQGEMGGVRSGVLFDAPRRAVRVVEGVVGAAHLGGPVLEGVERAWVSPSGRAAVARLSWGWALVTGLGGEAVEERELGYEVTAARWAAGGRHVAVIGGERIEVWDVEGMETVVRVDLGEGREAASVAVSDEGELAVAWFDGAETAAEAWRQGQWEEVARVKGRGVVAMGGRRLVLAGEGEVAVIESGGQVWRAQAERRGAPAGIEIVDGEVVAAYGGEAPALAVWPAEGGEARILELEAAPERLERAGGWER